MGWKDEGRKVFDRCNEEQRNYLSNKLVLDADDLFLLDTPTLRRMFAAKNSDAINNRLLIFTLVWQVFLKLLAKELEPPKGNVRGVWYDQTDPLYTQNGLYEHGTMLDEDYSAFLTQYYPQPGMVASLNDIGAKMSYVTDVTEDGLQAFVTRGIFRYQPFQFKDPNAAYRVIGEKAASRVMTVEKLGLFDRFCMRYVRKYKISAFASNGEPSLLATENFARRLEQKKIRRVVIAALTDYDPWGFNIAYSLAEKLAYFGIEAKVTHITSLSMWLPETIERQSYPLDFPEESSHWELVDRWFLKTGGINGQKRAIHLNVAQDDLVDRVMAKWWSTNKP